MTTPSRSAVIQGSKPFEDLADDDKRKLLQTVLARVRSEPPAGRVQKLTTMLLAKWPSPRVRLPKTANTDDETDAVLVYTASLSRLSAYLPTDDVPAWKFSGPIDQAAPKAGKNLPLESSILPWIPRSLIPDPNLRRLSSLPPPFVYRLKLATLARDRSQKQHDVLTTRQREICAALFNFFAEARGSSEAAGCDLAKCRFNFYSPSVIDIYWPASLPPFSMDVFKSDKNVKLHAQGQRCPGYFQTLTVIGRTDSPTSSVAHMIDLQLPYRATRQAILVDLWQREVLMRFRSDAPYVPMATQHFEAVVLLLDRERETQLCDEFGYPLLSSRHTSPDPLKPSMKPATVLAGLPGYMHMEGSCSFMLSYPERTTHCSECKQVFEYIPYCDDCCRRCIEYEMRRGEDDEDDDDAHEFDMETHECMDTRDAD